MSDVNAQDAMHRTPYNTTTSLLSHIIPLVIFACQSLHMRYALRPWWSLTKLGHILLRIFFPESIIWFVGREEWERRWVVHEIERRLEEKGQLSEEWDEGSALQKVMNIQAGRVFFRFMDGRGEEKTAMRKEMRNKDDELPAMPEAPESRRPSRHDHQESRRPSHQSQTQGYSPRHPGYYPAQEGLSPYLSPAGVSPHSGPRITPPYPISEFNLPLDNSPPSPQHPTNLQRPSNQSADASHRPSLHRNRTSETQVTSALLNSTPNYLSHRKPRIIWSLPPPNHLRRLVATDIPLYIDILHLLPPGSPTYISLINLHLALPPDLPTVLLISQLIWAITALALRSHAYSLGGEATISLLEMYAIYALIAFLIERLAIVGCRRPAWGGSGSGGYVIVEMNKEDYVHEVQDLPPKRGSRGSRWRGHQYFWIPLVFMGLAYPVVLVIYAAGIYKAGSMSGAPQIPVVIGVVTGTYVLAVLTFLGFN